MKVLTYKNKREITAFYAYPLGKRCRYLTPNL